MEGGNRKIAQTVNYNILLYQHAINCKYLHWIRSCYPIPGQLWVSPRGRVICVFTIIYCPSKILRFLKTLIPIIVCTSVPIINIDNYVGDCKLHCKCIFCVCEWNRYDFTLLYP